MYIVYIHELLARPISWAAAEMGACMRTKPWSWLLDHFGVGNMLFGWDALYLEWMRNFKMMTTTRAMFRGCGNGLHCVPTITLPYNAFFFLRDIHLFPLHINDTWEFDTEGCHNHNIPTWERLRVEFDSLHGYACVYFCFEVCGFSSKCGAHNSLRTSSPCG